MAQDLLLDTHRPWLVLDLAVGRRFYRFGTERLATGVNLIFRAYPIKLDLGGFQRKIPEKGRIGLRDRENDALGFVLRRFLWVSRYLIPPHFASIWGELRRGLKPIQQLHILVVRADPEPFHGIGFTKRQGAVLATNPNGPDRILRLGLFKLEALVKRILSP